MTNSFYGQYADQLLDEETLITPESAQEIVPAEPVVKEEESKELRIN